MNQNTMAGYRSELSGWNVNQHVCGTSVSQAETLSSSYISFLGLFHHVHINEVGLSLVISLEAHRQGRGGKEALGPEDVLSKTAS